VSEKIWAWVDQQDEAIVAVLGEAGMVSACLPSAVGKEATGRPFIGLVRSQPASPSAIPRSILLRGPNRKAFRKYAVDGSLQPFHGFTIVSFLAPDSPLANLLDCVAQALATRLDYAAFAPPLCPASHHVTIMDLCHERRDNYAASVHRVCSNAGALDAILAEYGAAGFSFRITDIEVSGVVIITLAVVDSDRPRFVALREALSARLGWSPAAVMPSLEQLHVTIAYRLWGYCDADSSGESIQSAARSIAAPLLEKGQVLSVTRPRLCSFENMETFVPLL